LGDAPLAAPGHHYQALDGKAAVRRKATTTGVDETGGRRMLTEYSETRLPGSWANLARHWSSWAARVWRRRGWRNDRSIIVTVEYGGASVPVVLEDGLPDDAYESLLTIDPASDGPGPLRFDRFHGEWRAFEKQAS
jgi:hypothetical protein